MRGIVHAVAYESDLAIVCEFTDLAHLILRKHLGINLIWSKAKLCADA